MKVSHWIRLLCVLALFVCAGCPTTEGYVVGPKPPHGFTYVMMDAARARRLGLESVAEKAGGEDADDEDRTGIVITGGAQFGTYAGSAVPVTLTTIKVDATGESSYAMDGIKVYAGSGYLPGAPTDGTLVTDLPNTGTLNPTMVTISSFENPAPSYDTNDQAYWIWVVIDGKKSGVSKPINGYLQLELIADSWGAGFYEY